MRVISVDRPVFLLSFSNNGESLVIVSDLQSVEGFELSYWKWLSNKAIASTRFTERINRIRINPSDETQITATGHGYFKQWKLNGHDNSLKNTSLLSGSNAEVSYPSVFLFPNIFSLSFIISENACVR
jgi:hypothetical protein